MLFVVLWENFGGIFSRRTSINATIFIAFSTSASQIYVRISSLGQFLLDFDKFIVHFQLTRLSFRCKWG